MKNYSKYKNWLIILILPLAIVMCMTIESITHPEDPQVNSEIEIGVKVKLEPENDDNTKMVFAVLAPQSWNIAENAELTFTTTGYTKGDVVNEPLTLVSESDVEPTTALPWSAAIQSEFGLLGNLGPVEWVVFESQTTFIITDEDETLINADVDIKLTTGSQNIKLFMGYFFCGKNRGFHEEYFTENAKSKVLTVTGGSNAMIDYTSVSLVSTLPASYGWGDIFSINFQTEAGPVETELKGADKVYMYGKAIYANGTDSAIVDVISDKTLMEKVGETTWQKYIYPKDFFDLPDDAVIDEAYFYFTNEDKSIIVKDPSGGDFLITETCN
ncbi:protein of unknown function [Tangfeifania diversioriginum]|uniref:DUF4961 domain-containing protein n=1 Tax=Tangfeifania diversioriginum TaxID=1168035 RepID=A0A1M6MYG6_9BACT|nr:DUF4961 domain-containing protein [Tangfeifania diversioriginum]SHJ88462.1 protein of unknown function [Tangfeifania diversioriginum]